MRWQAAICDDDPAAAEYVRSLVQEWAAQSGALLDLQIFPSAEAFLFCYADKKDFDLLLLDVEMADMDGVTLAKTLRQENQEVQIVFITGYSDYIAEGYDVAALHYLMKPVRREKLFSVLDRAAEKLRQNERALYFEYMGEMVRVPLSRIRSLEVQQNYVTVHADQDYTVKKSLAEFEKELDDGFFRTGRSWIINLAYVQRVTRTQALLTDGTAVPLSRGLYDKLNRAVIQHA